MPYPRPRHLASHLHPPMHPLPPLLPPPIHLHICIYHTPPQFLLLFCCRPCPHPSSPCSSIDFLAQGPCTGHAHHILRLLNISRRTKIHLQSSGTNLGHGIHVTLGCQQLPHNPVVPFIRSNVQGSPSLQQSQAVSYTIHTSTSQHEVREEMSTMSQGVTTSYTNPARSNAQHSPTFSTFIPLEGD